jgi:uncharacterized membrane protein
MMAENSTELVVLLFDDVGKADKALAEVKGLANYKSLKIVDAAVLTRDGEGKVTLKETNDFSGKKGAAVGAVGGALVALLAGPVGWVAGAAVGAGIGGVGAHLGDRGLPNQALEELKTQLGPNSSMLIVQVEYEWAGTLKDSFETKAVATSSWQITSPTQSQTALGGMGSTSPPTS